MNKSTYQEIRNTIGQASEGQIFYFSDFEKLGSTKAIKTALTRLQKNSNIKAVAQGIYVFTRKQKEEINVVELAGAILQREDEFKRLPHSTVFSWIYENNIWGGENGEYNSGPGSYHKEVYDYAQVVSSFIIEFDVKKIVEIGCGDFNVSKLILNKLDIENKDYKYTGFDVVKGLVKRNNALYGSPKVKFRFKDTCNEILPSADLLIIRQVLQHLDNDSISKIVAKFKNYKYILVTEHQLSDKYDNIIPNLDKRTDAFIRMYMRSGVYLEKPPFNCVIDSKLFSISEDLGETESYINTYLIKST